MGLCLGPLKTWDSLVFLLPVA